MCWMDDLQVRRNAVTQEQINSVEPQQEMHPKDRKSNPARIDLKHRQLYYLAMQANTAWKKAEQEPKIGSSGTLRAQKIRLSILELDADVIHHILTQSLGHNYGTFYRPGLITKGWYLVTRPYIPVTLDLDFPRTLTRAEMRSVPRHY